jgi:hypothetical protein
MNNCKLQFQQSRVDLAHLHPSFLPGSADRRKQTGFTKAVTLATIATGLGLLAGAVAEPVFAQPIEPTPIPEIDTSISRDYEPAIVYMHDPLTHQLVPHSVLVTAEQPVEGAVGQILQSYEGQDVGITEYEVEVDPVEHEAAIHFSISHPRGSDAMQSLSSANQYALLEAIRETLLTQPSFEVEEVIFLANGEAIDI